MFTNFNFQQILSAFIVLFAVIDIIGAIPIIIDLKDKGKDVNALKATLISFLLLLGFFYAGEATLVPLVFPLLAGAGSFTTLLSLRAEYASVNIIVALILNMLWVYFVVRMTRKVERVLGKGGIYLIRKFFGIILLAISVKLFMSNITLLMEQIEASTKAI